MSVMVAMSFNQTHQIRGARERRRPPSSCLGAEAGSIYATWRLGQKSTRGYVMSPEGKQPDEGTPSPLDQHERRPLAHGRSMDVP